MKCIFVLSEPGCDDNDQLIAASYDVDQLKSFADGIAKECDIDQTWMDEGNGEWTAIGWPSYDSGFSIRPVKVIDTSLESQ